MDRPAGCRVADIVGGMSRTSTRRSGREVAGVEGRHDEEARGERKGRGGRGWKGRKALEVTGSALVANRAAAAASIC